MDPRELPSLEEPGTVCPECGEPMRLEGFCGACAEADEPRSFDAFLSYAVRSTVEGGSGKWPR